MREHGLTYGRFIDGLNKAGIELDRKVLADIAVHEPATFKGLVEAAVRCGAGLESRYTRGLARGLGRPTAMSALELDSLKTELLRRHRGSARDLARWKRCASPRSARRAASPS